MNKQFREWFFKQPLGESAADHFWDAVNRNDRQEVLSWVKRAYEKGYTDGQKLYGGTE